MLYLDTTLIIEVVLFLLFLYILNRVFYRPLADIIRQRAERVEAGVRAAEQSRRAAAETQQEVQRLLEQARAEAQEIIATVNKEAAAQRQALLDQARSQASLLIEQAQEDIRHERATAVEELRRAASPLAILVASKVVGQSLDSPANRALAEQTVAEASGSGNGMR